MKWSVHAWERREMLTVFWLGNLKGKGSLRRRRRRWEDDIRMNLREIRWEGVD
jgi:hypothetical protein